MGLTASEALAVLSRGPTLVVYPGSEYHCHLALVPRLPPVCVKVTLVPAPLHITESVAFNAVGATFGWLAVIITVFESAQVPLDNFHFSVFAPVPSAVIVVVGLVGVVMVPLPLTILHKPVPTVGESAAIVAAAHTVWFRPALTGEG